MFQCLKSWLKRFEHCNHRTLKTWLLMGTGFSSRCGNRVKSFWSYWLNSSWSCERLQTRESGFWLKAVHNMSRSLLWWFLVFIRLTYEFRAVNMNLQIQPWISSLGARLQPPKILWGCFLLSFLASSSSFIWFLLGPNRNQQSGALQSDQCILFSGKLLNFGI